MGILQFNNELPGYKMHMADSYIWFVVKYNVHYVFYIIQHKFLFFDDLLSNINNMKFIVVFLLFVLLLFIVEIDIVMRLSYGYFSHNEYLNVISIYNDLNTYIYIQSSTSSAKVLVLKNYQIEYLPVRKFDHKEYSYRFLCPYL